MKKSRFIRSRLIVMIVAILVICSSAFSYAGTSISRVNYKGSGKVEITFSEKVTYDNPKVSVKDNSSKSYNTKITSKSKTMIKFTIAGCKAGKTYKVTISGIKSGTASKTFKIITKNTAVSMAKKKAKKLGATSFSNLSAQSTTYKNTAVWKVSFDSAGYSYTYHISQQGMVLRSDKKAK